MLAHHGVAFCGESVPDLVLTGLFLERAAAAQLTLAATGLAVTEADAADALNKRSRTCGAEAVAAIWAYHKRVDARSGGQTVEGMAGCA